MTWPGVGIASGSPARCRKLIHRPGARRRKPAVRRRGDRPVRTIDAPRLHRVVDAIFAAAGCRPEESARVARHLVESNLAGHDSHGVIRVPAYIDWLRSGKVLANQTPEVVTET